MAGVRKEQDDGKLKKSSTKSKPIKKKQIDIKDPDFVPPDGGWGWMIVLAAGFSNFCVLTLVQSFGLLFMDKFSQLGITASEITTLTSSNCAVTAFTGLANGPLFKKFTFRKLAFVGSLLCTLSAVMLSFVKTFTGYLAFFSVINGIGIGLTLSSNSLALNTYFKEKRRIAIGLSWTCAGMAPIIMPQVITVLMPKYGMEGTVLLFGGFAFHAVACSLLLQPVSWHCTKKKKIEKVEVENENEKGKSEDLLNEQLNPLLNGSISKSKENVAQHRRSTNLTESRTSQLFGSQYLYYDDKEEGASGIDVIDAGLPMMSKANDGWQNNNNSENVIKEENKNESNANNVSTKVKETKDSVTKENNSLTPSNNMHEKRIDEKNEKKNLIIYWGKRCCKSLVQAFDLNLLRDPIYVNMMLGVTLANFVELNFALLTAFILGSYGFSRIQIATWMSVLAGMDVFTRISIPFVSTYIGWENRTFFLIGVCGMALGRIVLAHVRNYAVILAIAALIGAGKALRTIFIALVIPGYVPLSRLPAALGLQLVTSGIIFFAIGPVIGWIQDTSKNYTVTLHCLNIFTYLVAISWIVESQCVKYRKSKSVSDDKKTCAA